MTQSTALQDIIIIGSGPAGCTAAIYAARAGLRTTLLTGYQEGGQLTTTTTIENFPGFAAPITGTALMDQMSAQAAHCGATIIMDNVHTIRNSTDDTEPGTPGHTWTIEGDIESYTTRSIIIASGSVPKWTDKPGEGTWKNRGISSCATCDGAFYKGKQVAVIGGGNTALEEALYLSNIAQHVHIIHRRSTFRAEHPLQQAVRTATNITVHWDTEVEEFLGTQELHGIRVHAHGTSWTLPIDGVFVAIGHTPTSGLYPGIQTDAQGYIQTSRGHTSVPGILAAGDVQDPLYRQAITAAASGCVAAIEAHTYLMNHQPPHGS